MPVTLKKNDDRKALVIRLQQALVDAGLTDLLGASPTDGGFGSGTEDAIREFQKRNAQYGLTVTGIADPKTIALLGLDPENLFCVDPANLTRIDILETGNVWVLSCAPSEAFFTIGELALDWDGDPMAYADKKKYPDLNPHDNLGNAGSPGNWWGVVTDTGKKDGTPVEQDGIAPAQPHKNYMISATKLVDKRYPEKDIRRWTDATKVPYIALPNSRASMQSIGLQTGCYCVMVNLQTMKFCYGVYADSKGTKARMGEVSKRAHDLLGGKFGSIFIMAFPKSGKGQGSIPDEATIEAESREALQTLSLLDENDHLISSLSKIPGLASLLIEAGYMAL
jgi:hypothetical protein